MYLEMLLIMMNPQYYIFFTVLIFKSSQVLLNYLIVKCGINMQLFYNWKIFFYCTEYCLGNIFVYSNFFLGNIINGKNSKTLTKMLLLFNFKNINKMFFYIYSIFLTEKASLGCLETVGILMECCS